MEVAARITNVVISDDGTYILKLHLNYRPRTCIVTPSLLSKRPLSHRARLIGHLQTGKYVFGETNAFSDLIR